MKVLFVYPKLLAKSSGGIQCSRRNHRALVHIFGDDNVISYPIERKSNRFCLRQVINHFLELGFGGLDRSDKKNIIKLIESEKINYVHIDSSTFGSLAKYICEHTTNVKIITFFHNVEYDFFKSTLPSSFKGIMMSYRLPLIKLAENYSLKYSNINISLHKKDSSRLCQLYGKKADCLIPITLDDSLAIIETQKTYGNKLRLLFFGANFKPNLEAVDILINKILPQVKIQVELLVAGDGMDVISDKYKKDVNYVVKGFVEDLNDMYNWADIVILPIFIGAGMKVKTAEALLYGKNLIASDVALDGYEVDDISGIVRCHNIEDFVEAINSWDKSLPRFNKAARQLFESYYSYEASYKLFKEAYNRLL